MRLKQIMKGLSIGESFMHDRDKRSNLYTSARDLGITVSVSLENDFEIKVKRIK